MNYNGPSKADVKKMLEEEDEFEDDGDEFEDEFEDDEDFE